MKFKNTKQFQLERQVHQCQLSIISFLMKETTGGGKYLPQLLGCEVEQEMQVRQGSPAGGSAAAEADCCGGLDSVLWESRDRQALGWLSHGFILLVLERKEPMAAVLQDWPFAVILTGSRAGGYWLIEGPVLQHHLPGVGHSTLRRWAVASLLRSIIWVKPRGCFILSTGKVSLHVFLKWTTFGCISSRCALLAKLCFHVTGSAVLPKSVHSRELLSSLEPATRQVMRGTIFCTDKERRNKGRFAVLIDGGAEKNTCLLINRVLFLRNR